MESKQTNIAFINHDLRNNIGAAISHIQLLIMETPELEDNEDLAFAVEALKCAIELTYEISIICTADNQGTERSESDFEVFNIKNYWDSYSKKSYKELRKKHNIEINDKYITLDENKFCAINPIAMYSVRENLINNALKAGATKIDVYYEMRENYGVVSFHDNGRGMTQGDIDKIILAQHGDGVIHGVGTKIILTQIKEHGFYITYSSKNSKGTTARIIFPYRNE